MKIIDLSHVISKDMPVFPGIGFPEISQSFSLDKGDICNAHDFKFNTHLGTHIDVPFHMIKNGITVDQMPLNRFFGKAAVLDLKGLNTRIIEAADLEHFQEQIRHVDFLLIHTGWSDLWGKAEYFRDYPVLSEDAALWIIQFKIKGLGIDLASVDLNGSPDVPVHRILLGSNVIIIENLTNLRSLINEEFLFVCLPLNIHGADGVPVRAAGITGLAYPGT